MQRNNSSCRDGDVDLSVLVNKKIQEIDYLLAVCEKLPKSIGSKRLVNKFIAEKKVLLKHASKLENTTEEHLRSSNVPHLSSILWCAMTSEGVVEILKPFILTDGLGARVRRIVVDVVADLGTTWIKVVARNPQAILQSEIGDVSYGRKTLAEQVEQLKECAQKNPHLYQTPKMQILFAAGVYPEMKATLERQGVDVLEASINLNRFLELSNDNLTKIETNRKVQEVTHSRECASSNTSQVVEAENAVTLWNMKLHRIPYEAVLNLDVSTMIAYVSSLTNGNCNFKFQSAVLSEQAQCEREKPVKPCLEELFKGKKLICCTTAFKDFTDIVNTIGGEQEKVRAQKLLATVDVVDDQPSSKALALGKSDKVKSRPQVVFGTGDTMKAITVTANKGFLRAAQAQGKHFVAFLHESRALTEANETTAVKLDDAVK